MRNKITLAFVAITAVLTTVGLSVTSDADAAPAPGDCNRVAKADRPLCLRVSSQLSYTYGTKSGVNKIMDGKTLVHEITHQGLTKAEMRSYLRGEALNYARFAITDTSIIVNTGTMRKHYVPHANYEIHTQGKHILPSIVQP